MPMIPQFSSTTLLSFHLWLDNLITQRGQGYTNTTTQLFYQQDSKMPGYVAYASPFRSWVCDSGVSGAAIPNSVSGSFGTPTRQSGMIVDFENGRVLFPSAFGTTAIVSGTYAFKDLNIYKANETQEDMVFTNKYYLNSRFARPITGIPPAYDMVTPCVFISDVSSENEPYAFGGMYQTDMKISLCVMAENMTQWEGVNSLMTDSLHAVIPQLPFSAWPLNPYGDYKSGYNYEAIKAQYCTPANQYMITDVRASKVTDLIKVDQGIFLGIVDLTVSKPRTIH